MDALTVLADLTAEERARPALVTDTFAWSFADLARRASAMIARLEARGVRPSHRVALVASPTPEVFLAIHALAVMGATLVPIHPRLSAEEARVTVEVAHADHVLTPDDLALPSSAEQAPAPARAYVPAPAPAAPFAIVSTSGTTGRPKGAVLSRRAFVASAAASAQNLGWRPDDRWLLNMPLGHVGGLSILTRCLAARRTVVLLAPSPRFDPAVVLDAIERHRVTLLSVVPTMLHALLEADARDTLRLPRAILVGGAATSPALLDACAERRVRALTTYGLTEACSQVTTQPPRDPAVRGAGSGPPLEGFDLRIADDGGEALRPGSTGRILIRGPALFDGYLTGDGRSIDPSTSAAGYFDTGDIGELDERGHLHVHVRRTDLIVTGGENVYPAEVEQAIERLPGVRRALVFGSPDERWGHVVCAAIEAGPGEAPSPDTLLALVSSTLARHKRPRRWAVVDRLPLTPSGKVDRKDALARFGGLLRPA